jgi:hypothetical protein
MLIVFPSDEQVGKHGWLRRGEPFEPASLREDYLNQVQRDFLSRPRPVARAGPTPLAIGCMRCSRAEV